MASRNTVPVGTLVTTTAGLIANRLANRRIELLRPYPADETEAFEVSKDVGNVKTMRRSC